MKLFIDPVSLAIIAISIIGSWLWSEAVSEPICPVHELHDGKLVEVPYLCKDVLK